MIAFRPRWKHLNQLIGAAGLLAAGIGFLRSPAGSGCGVLILSRWSVPFFSTLVIVAAASLAIGFFATVSSESRNRALATALLPLGLGLGLTLGALDLAIRLTVPPISHRPPSLQYYPHDVLGYIRPPNTKFEWPSDMNEFRPTHRTDQWGLVMPDGRTNQPRPEAMRIMFLGDSFIAGLQVELEENLSEQTASILRDETQNEWQAINLGMDSYSPLRYYLAYQEFADIFDPQIVVVGIFVGNDFTDTVPLYLQDLVQVDSQGRPTAIKFDYVFERPRLMPEAEWKKGVLNVFRELAYRRLCRQLEWQQIGPTHYFDRDPSTLDTPPFDDGQGLACLDAVETGASTCFNYAIRDVTSIRANNDAIFKATYSELDLADIELSLDALRLLAEAVQEDGRSLIIVIFPEANQIPDQGEGYKPERGLHIGEVIQETTPQILLMEFCHQEGLDCIDLLPVLREHSNEQLYWVYDSHLTPRGHRLVAEQVADEILALPLSGQPD